MDTASARTAPSAQPVRGVLERRTTVDALASGAEELLPVGTGGLSSTSRRPLVTVETLDPRPERSVRLCSP